MLETSLVASLVAFVAGLGILTVLFICLIPIALYIFSSFGLYTMALKKTSSIHGWLGSQLSNSLY